MNVRHGVWDWGEGAGNVPVRLGKRTREDSGVDEESDRDGAGEVEDRHRGGRNTRPRTETDVGPINETTQEMVVDEETAVEWAAAVQKLVKGKTKMERQVRGIESGLGVGLCTDDV